MVLIDIFKKKKKPQEKEIKSSEPKRKEEIIASKRQKKVVLSGAWGILKNLHITEKATDLAAKNQYVFKVLPKANKTEIKKSVADLYGVDVLGVKIIKRLRKRKRLGKISGWKSGYKKAIVKIKEGQKIEVLAR